MLYEYAVEPRAIGSSWQTFRYVIEKFGFDRGRLISQFPNTWFRLVYDATEAFLDHGMSKSAGQIKGAIQVHAQHPLPHARFESPDLTGAVDAGVVH